MKKSLRIILIGAIMIIPPILFLVILAMAGRFTLAADVDTFLKILAAFAGWIGFLAIVSQLFGVSVKELLGSDEEEPAARGEVPGGSSSGPYQPPRPLPEFSGREEELKRLAKALRPGRKTAITGLVGMGGLGKTELAKLAAERARGRFPDGVL